MKESRNGLLAREGTKSVLASLISIVIGMAVGALIVVLIGLFNPAMGLNTMWEGVRLVFAGLFSTGRDAAGGNGQKGHSVLKNSFPVHQLYIS